MKNTLTYSFLIGIMALTLGLASCSDDETFAPPTLTLSETSATASPGDVVSVTIDAATAAGFKSLVITKLWDGTSQSSETLDALPTGAYAYTVTDEDADHVLTINFTLTDTQDRTIAAELVITVELTPRQLLLKYNWRLSEEIRKKTNKDDITDAYNDDIYRFNADGTYDKSIGEKADNFGDLITNYCFYDLNDGTMRLLMSRSENFFGTDAVDTLDITVIDDSKMYADITYYGLDAFNDGSQETPYESVEDYEKRFVAVAKTSSFDPYNPGGDDDAGPGECRDVELVNN